MIKEKSGAEGTKLLSRELRPGAGQTDRYIWLQLQALFVANPGELIIQDNVICFENVPLVTPNGDVLIDNLNLEVSDASRS